MICERDTAARFAETIRVVQSRYGQQGDARKRGQAVAEPGQAARDSAADP